MALCQTLIWFALRTDLSRSAGEVEFAYPCCTRTPPMLDAAGRYGAGATRRAARMASCTQDDFGGRRNNNRIRRRAG